VLRELFAQGMIGVRLNLSHVRLSECQKWVENLFTAAAAIGVPAELIIDLQGPELRVGIIDPAVTLTEGESVRLGEGGISVPEQIFPGLGSGQEILLDDGRMMVRVTSVFDNHAFCHIMRGGVLASRKSVTLPGRDIHLPIMTQTDLLNLSLAKEYGVTGVMQPFVQSGEELRSVRNAIHQAGAHNIKLYAKLESVRGVENLPELITEADEIVIARGDLGNAFSLWELPGIQKDIASICRKAGKPFMVATQILYTMEHSAVPTRAEVSDVFNAVLDGASSLLVTGETAVGLYPVEVIRFLHLTAQEALRYKARLQ
jgi:pyruvate kinase